MSTLIEPQKAFSFQPPTTASAILLPAWVRLEPGVHTLMVSWDAPRPLIITRSATQAHAGRMEIDRVQAGSGRRHRMVVGVDVRAGEDCWVSLMQDGLPVPPGARASMIAFSTPLAGGVASGLLSAVRWLLGGGGHDHTRHNAACGALRSPNRLGIPDDPRSAAQRLQLLSHVGAGGVDAVADRVAWPVPTPERPWGIAHHAGPHELGDTPAGDRHRPTWHDGANLGADREHRPGDAGGCHWWAARCCADHPRAELHPLTRVGVVA